MGRMLIFVYGLVSYSIFLITSLYFAGFVGNQVVPKSIDSGEPVAFGRALLADTLLLGLLAVQHSVMARGSFKRWLTRFVPEPAERSTYVFFSSLVLIFLFWQWRPMTGMVWSVENPAVSVVLTSLFWAGWMLVVISSCLVDHFDLFGLRQAYRYLKGREYTHVGFKTPALYRLVRHPIMLGHLIVFWSTPLMSVGHLFFAAAMSVYILIGVRLEERDLVSIHGAPYEKYQQQVSMLLPFPKNK